MGLFNIFKKKPSINFKEPKLSKREVKKTPTWVDAQFEDDPVKKESILLSAEDYSENDVTKLHFTYNQLIELYYKQREEWESGLDECIKYCWKDVNIFPLFRETLLKDTEYNPSGTIPRIPSFQRLAIIYEKQGEIRKAISICEKAIDYELTDNTKGGFKGRLERLQKKI